MIGQQAFSDALRLPARAVPSGLRPAERFAVYRNNVASGLITALAVRYPAVKRLVGDEFFAGLALAFSARRLPASPALIFFGAEFPDFIAAFGPAKSLAYLSDVARLESLWWTAYHAVDAPSLDPVWLAELTPDRLAQTAFQFHPSAGVFASRHPVVAIIAAQRADGSLAGIDFQSAEAALVSRRDFATAIDRIDVAEATFIAKLMAGGRLGDCVDDGLDLTGALTRLVSSHIITGLIAP